MINLHILNAPLDNLRPSHRKLILQIRLRLRIERVLLARHLEIVRRFSITYDMLHQLRVPGHRGFDLQLDCAAAVQEAEEEAGFVYCAAG